MTFLHLIVASHLSYLRDSKTVSAARLIRSPTRLEGALPTWCIITQSRNTRFKVDLGWDYNIIGYCDQLPPSYVLYFVNPCPSSHGCTCTYLTC